MILMMDAAVIIAIIIIVLLVLSFFITFVINQRTPIPPGCEEILTDNEKCSACNNKACRFHEEKKEENITEE